MTDSYGSKVHTLLKIPPPPKYTVDTVFNQTSEVGFGMKIKKYKFLYQE